LTLVELCARDPAEFAQRGVLDQRGVPLRQNQTITIHPLRIALVELHLVEIEHRNRLGQRARSAQVAGLADTHHLQQVVTELQRLAFELLDQRFVCHVILLYETRPIYIFLLT
jgi:hypothetical protein